MIDAIEAINGRSTYSEDIIASQYAIGLNKPMTFGSDAHEFDDIGKHPIYTDKEIHNQQEFIEMLKKGEFS